VNIVPEKPKPKPDKDDRLVIPLDPEVALRALLEVDPEQMPEDDDDQPPVGER
jgi:hypothetical protein